MIAWESSQNLGMPTLVSPQNDLWKWLQKLYTGDVLCHYPDLSSASDCNFPFTLTTNKKHYRKLGIGTSTVWNFCSHFSDVISQGNQWWCWKMSAVFSGYLTVVQFSWCKVAMQLGVAMWVGTGLYVDPSSCSFPKKKVVMGRRDISLQNVVNCLREKQKFGLDWRVTRPAGREGGWPHCSTIIILYTPKKCNSVWAKYKRRSVTKIYPNSATRTYMYELVTKLGLRRTDNRFYYTTWRNDFSSPLLN